MYVMLAMCYVAYYLFIYIQSRFEARNVLKINTKIKSLISDIYNVTK